MPDQGGALHEGPCAHDDRNPDQVRGAAGGGLIQGKIAIHVEQVWRERRRNLVDQHCWVQDYFVSTSGRGEKAILDYIQSQKKEVGPLDQLKRGV